MNSLMRTLTSQTQRLANFIVLEGGEQGVLLVRPYTNDICAHWRFVDETIARDSSAKIYQMFLGFSQRRLHWYGHGEEIPGDGFYEYFRRYANHASGRKYDEVSGEVRLPGGRLANQ